MRILVVEDERHVAAAVEQLLTDCNYAVDIAADGEVGLEMAAVYAYDLIILDIGLPKLDGVEVCKQLRVGGASRNENRSYQNPILLLTGRQGSENKAIALNAGADDYVVKPFDAVELVARVQALLRRPVNGTHPILTWGKLTFDPNTRQVSYDARLLKLTPKEYAIVELLLRSPRSPISSRAILDRAWAAEEVPADEVIRTHIKQLRHKLVAAGAPKDLLKTVHGVGYRLNLEYAAVDDDAPEGTLRDRASSPQAVDPAAENAELRDTLERWRSTQDALRASEERYRALAELSPVGIFRNGADGHCTYVNQRTAQLVGYSPAECLALNWLETLHPEDREWVYRNWCAFMDRSKIDIAATHSFECRHLHPNGEIVWVLVQIVPEHDAGCAITGYMGTLTDITERKRREANQSVLIEIADDLQRLTHPDEMMQAIGERLGAHLKLSSCLFVNVDDERGEVTVHHGWQQDDLPNMQQQMYRLSDYLTPEFASTCRAGAITVICDTASDDRTDTQAYAALNIGAFLILPFQWEGRWIAQLAVTNTAPRNWQSDEIELLRDIADRVFLRIERARAEAALRESESQLQSITNLVPDLLWESEPDGSTNWYNQCWMEYTGQTFDRAIGWGWVDAIHPADREGSARRYREAVARGLPLQQEHRIRRHDGAYRWFVVKASPLKDESGKVIKMYGAATDIHDRRVATEAVRESEAKYRSLFNAMDEGYLLSEVIFDENDTPIDILYLEANPAAIRLAGRDFSGQRMREIDPNYEEHWYEIYGRVALAGEAVRAQRYAEPHGRWFDFYAFKVGAGESRRVATVFADITERKQTEERSLRAAQLDAFRIALTDALRAIAEPIEIQATASRTLGEYLNANRVVYFEIRGTNYFVERDYVNGATPLSGNYPLASFSPNVLAAQCAGRTISVPDVAANPDLSPEQQAAYAAIGIAAHLDVSLVKNGEFIAGLAVHVSQPRAWTPDEIALCEEVAERTWAAIERARAEQQLQASEEKYRSLFESIDEGFCLLEVLFDADETAYDYRFLEVNPAFAAQSGLSDATGKTILELVPNLEPQWAEQYGQVAKSGTAVRFTADVPSMNRVFDIYAFPSSDGSREHVVAVVFTDITDRQRRAANQAVLVEIADDLQRLTNPDEIMQSVGERLGVYLNLGACVFVDADEQRGEVTVHHGWNRDGVTSLNQQTFRIGDYVSAEFQRANRAGETIVVRDTATDERTNADAYARMNIGAWLCVPYHRSGCWTAFLSVTDTAPRDWQVDEIELLQEISNRIFPRIERARTEAALREREGLLSLALTAAEAGTWDLDIPTDRWIWSDRLFELLGYRVGEVLPSRAAWHDRIHPDDLEMTERAIRRNLETGSLGEVEYRIIRPDESVHWLLVKAQVIYAPSGQPVRMVGIAIEITDRKRTEIDTQTNLGIAIEAAQLGTWYWDVQRDVAPVRSLRHDQIFGYDTLQPEWGREIAIRHVVEADREIFDAALDRGIATGELDFEVRVQWSDGSIHWMAARGRFDYDREGNVTYGYGVNFDITEQKQAAAELQAQQRLLEQITESTTAILYIYDPIDCRTIYANAQVETILGYTPAAICAMGANQIELVHPDDVPALLAALDRCSGAADDEIVEYEYRMRDINGEWHWLQSRDRVLKRTADGAVKQKIGTAIDITARKQAENKIEEQAALLDIATDAIFVRCLAHRILYWNQGAERMYGRSAAEAIARGAGFANGHTATELLREPVDRIAEIVQTVLERGEWHGELHKFCKSGQELTVQARWTLLRDETGQPKSILCVDTDITGTRQLQAQFYQAQRLESLGTLASGIAHDLNNVLTPILAFAQLMRSQPAIDQKTQGRLQIIEDSARRGSEMVKQILTFARGVIGEQSALQLNHLLQDLVTVVRQTFPKSIDIDLHLLDNLWLVVGNATQLNQVFLNLCVNARDAMPQGGRLRITAANRAIDEMFVRLNLNVRPGNYVLVTISDTGTGIAPEILDRIFDPFFTTKPIGEGTGLGLATVLGIVTNHGGFVRVASNVGRGTEFKVYLPTATEGEPTDTRSTSDLPDGNGELILIVDDDPAVREANRSLLEDHNYQTVTANDGIEAMAVYAQQMQAIDLVLIDAMMPNTGGEIAIRAMRQMNPHVKIVAMSGLSSNQESTLEAGARVFLSKPYQLADLLRSISDLLNS